MESDAIDETNIAALVLFFSSSNQKHSKLSY